jgi:hypothetical protein
MLRVYGIVQSQFALNILMLELAAWTTQAAIAM